MAPAALASTSLVVVIQVVAAATSPAFGPVAVTPPAVGGGPVMADSLTVTTGTLPPVLPVAQHTAAAAAQLVIKSSESTKTVN